MTSGNGGDDPVPWYGDEAFWDTFYDFMFGEARFRKAESDVKAITRQLATEPGEVLDLGCGPGRHVLPFARAGWRVTAVDLSPGLLERGRARLEEAGLEAEWVESDMRSFSRPGSFDLAVSLWTSFGYFEDPADDMQVLTNVVESLKPGGAFVLDVIGKEWLCRNIQPVHLTELEDGSLLVERPVFADNMTRIQNEWLLISGDRVYRREWSHQVYSGQELADRLHAAGFDKVSLFGSFDGDEYDLEAERLIAVARKS